MRFGPTPVDDALGAILAHGTRHAEGMFKKGRILSTDDIAALKEAGVTSVVTARLSDDDIAEDEAARQVSVAACGAGARAQEPFTGRANLYSTSKGLLVIDEMRLQAINHLHEALTIATLPNHSRVAPKQMVATIKVIPFAVPRIVLEQALAIIAGLPLARVAPFRPREAGLVITTLPQTKPSLVSKSETAMRDRLEAMGATLGKVMACGHDRAEIAHRIGEMRNGGYDPILVMGASAIVDRMDVIPAGLVDAGGEVIHLGMPVDPGNLLMLGQVAATPVVGVPSCARSPKVNGFDWVLERLVADVPVTASDIMDMGLGGLLAEIPSRPTPREGQGAVPAAPKVTAIVLAAGLSSRMGSNKLMADFNGVPLLSVTLERIRQSSVDDIIVVTGKDADVSYTAGNAPVRTVNNPDYAKGISTSIKVGIAAAQGSDAVVICLGDMPLIDPRTIDRLIAAFNPTEHRTIVAPVHKGQFGNPVLWGAEHFAKLAALEGDKGARSLIGEMKREAVEINVEDAGVLADADTPEALAALRVQAATT